LRGQAFNFSNELQITVLGLVEAISEALESDLLPDIRNEAVHEIQHQYLSAAKARDILGWKPMFDLSEGLRRTASWYTDFLLRNHGLQDV
jgi:CDP-glucose 4,6-dehydratase